VMLMDGQDIDEDEGGDGVDLEHDIYASRLEQDDFASACMNVDGETSEVPERRVSSRPRRATLKAKKTEK
jgi:hypothetical protein